MGQADTVGRRRTYASRDAATHLPRAQGTWCHRASDPADADRTLERCMPAYACTDLDSDARREPLSDALACRRRRCRSRGFAKRSFSSSRRSNSNNRHSSSATSNHTACAISLSSMLECGRRRQRRSTGVLGRPLGRQRRLHSTQPPQAFAAGRSLDRLSCHRHDGRAGARTSATRETQPASEKHERLESCAGSFERRRQPEEACPARYCCFCKCWWWS